MSRKRKDQPPAPEPMPTLQLSSRSAESCLRCGKPREIGDSCRACYLLVSQQMAATVRDEPRKITVWTRPGTAGNK